MSCSPEVVNWMNKCYDEEAALARTRDITEENTCDLMNFKKDINGRSCKTTFGGHHLPNTRNKNYNSRHVYEISIPSRELRGPHTVAYGHAFLKKTKDFPSMRWSSAILCGYDPKRDNIMFEVSSVERGYSYHTMKMTRLEKLISINQITIKKI